MMKKIDIEILLRVIDGKATAMHEKEFNAWHATSQSHKAYFKKLKAHRNRNIEDFDLALVDKQTDAFISKLTSKRKQLLIGTVLRYAAVILLPLAVGATLWFYTGANFDEQFAGQSLLDVKKQDKTMLITSSGNSYELTKGVEKKIQMSEGVNLGSDLAEEMVYANTTPKTEQIAYHTLRTASGDDYKIELSDGTVVHLNCKSELIYPVTFGEGARVVKLKGEAYFDVTKTGQTFQVEVNNMNIEVLGTRFNVMAYDDEDAMETTLVSGKVKVNVTDVGMRKSILLAPGDQASWNKFGKSLKSDEVNTELYTSWINGYLRFENQPLEDVMQDIARWYDVKIFYQNESLKNKKLSGKLYKMDDFDTISSMLEKISGLRVVRNKNAVVISNK